MRGGTELRGTIPAGTIKMHNNMHVHTHCILMYISLANMIRSVKRRALFRQTTILDFRQSKWIISSHPYKYTLEQIEPSRPKVHVTARKHSLREDSCYGIGSFSQIQSHD